MNQQKTLRQPHHIKRAIVAGVVGMTMVFSPIVVAAQWIDPVQLIKEFAVDTIIKILLQKIQQKIQTSIMNWANDPNAFNGSPSFVTNPKDLLSGVQSDATNIFFNHLQAAGICDAFKPGLTLDLSNFNLGLDLNWKVNTTNVTKSTCTLNSLIPSGNINDYFSVGGFVKQGGYAPMMRSLSSIDDNPDTLAEKAKAILEEERLKAAAIAKDEVALGSGFNAQKKCDQYDGATCIHYTIQTPGFNVGQTIQKNLTQPLDDLTNSHEFSDFIVAVLSALTQNAISQGLKP